MSTELFLALEPFGQGCDRTDLKVGRPSSGIPCGPEVVMVGGVGGVRGIVTEEVPTLEGEYKYV